MLIAKMHVANLTKIKPHFEPHIFTGKCNEKSFVSADKLSNIATNISNTDRFTTLRIQQLFFANLPSKGKTC